MLKKLFLIMLWCGNLFLLIACKKSYLITNNTDDFLNIIKDYQSFNEEFYDLYYQEYQLTNNIILSLNKVNYPDFFLNKYDFPSFNFEGGQFVNKNYYLAASYIPKNLVPVTINKVNRKGETMLINKEALSAASKLFDDAKSKGLNLVVFSAYRSFIKQKELYDNAKDKSYVAKAGYSEHQTGLALDIATLDTGLSIYFENTAEYLYLKNNAHLFGFINRYPKDKTMLTLYPYESWHFRFVGKSLAQKLYDENLTLEEYIYQYVELK